MSVKNIEKLQCLQRIADNAGTVVELMTHVGRRFSGARNECYTRDAFSRSEDREHEPRTIESAELQHLFRRYGVKVVKGLPSLLPSML